MGSFVLLKLSGDSAVMNSLKPRDAHSKKNLFCAFYGVCAKNNPEDGLLL